MKRKKNAFTDGLYKRLFYAKSILKLPNSMTTGLNAPEIINYFL
jgi:hypothetical protein